MKLKELAKTVLPRFSNGKAGCIPYIINDGKLEMLFFVSSNARYGGAEPMIAKGGIDDGESVETAGLREAEEELGLQQSNIVPDTIKLGWSGELVGLKHNYQFDVFMCEVKSKDAFDNPGKETKEVLWMTLDEFSQQGRKSHLDIVKAIASKIK